MKRYPKELTRKDRLLNKGEDKINKELDVVEVVRNAHIVQVMSSILFTEFEQWLLQFQKKNVLETSSSSEEESL